MEKQVAHVNDRVTIRAKGEVLDGTITEVERYFQEIMSDGSFDPDGLMTMESDVSNIQIPYTVCGDILAIFFGKDKFQSFDKIRLSKVKGYVYTVQVDNYPGLGQINMIVGPNQIIKNQK